MLKFHFHKTLFKMLKILSCFLRVTVFLLLCFCFVFSSSKITKGFKLTKLSLPLPSQNTCSVAQINNLQEILNQKFYFLNRGLQSYVFASKDNQYVIKFILKDNQIFLPKSWLNQKDQKLKNLMSSFDLAYAQAQQETALVYLHLSDTSNLLPKLLIETPTKQLAYIDLNHCHFAIQKKVMLLKDFFSGSYRQDKQQDLQKKIDAFLTLIKNRAIKGIYNSDSNIGRNFGFLEDDAVELDFGGYELVDMEPQDEYFRYKRKLRSLLEAKCPNMIPYLDSKEGF